MPRFGIKRLSFTSSWAAVAFEESKRSAFCPSNRQLEERLMLIDVLPANQDVGVVDHRRRRVWDDGDGQPTLPRGAGADLNPTGIRPVVGVQGREVLLQEDQDVRTVVGDECSRGPVLIVVSVEGSIEMPTRTHGGEALEFARILWNQFIAEKDFYQTPLWSK